MNVEFVLLKDVRPGDVFIFSSWCLCVCISKSEKGAVGKCLALYLGDLVDGSLAHVEVRDLVVTGVDTVRKFWTIRAPDMRLEFGDWEEVTA